VISCCRSRAFCSAAATSACVFSRASSWALEGFGVALGLFAGDVQPTVSAAICWRLPDEARPHRTRSESGGRRTDRPFICNGARSPGC
jgi:hypothetical protein